MRKLRLDGESDEAFRQRATRAVLMARLLTEACLRNRDVQAMLADSQDPHTEAGLRQNPIVRIDYEQAYAIAGIGEGLYATRNKHWGSGPTILPLEPDDPVRGRYILYVYKENSLYNRRFEQRQRMKDLLGRKFAPLVEAAKYQRHTKQMFLESLSEEQAAAIRRLLRVAPATFWRACRGKEFLKLPSPAEQTYFDFMADD
jgi:hypothetical protein